MALGDFGVQKVVGGCHFDRAGAEVGVYRFIGDHGNFSVLSPFGRSLVGGNRQNDFLVNQVLVSFVLGIDGYGRVAEHCFRSGCGHDNIFKI